MKKNTSINMSQETSTQVTLTHVTLCLLEELNDILYKGELETEKNIEQIIYQCKLLIDITE